MLERRPVRGLHERSMGSELKRKEKKTKQKTVKRHICSHCSKAFSFPNKLRNHIQSFHSMSHECEHCSAKFNRFNELRTHTAFAHHVQYKCPACAYSSSVKAELKKHIVVNHENGVCCTIDGCNVTVAYRKLKKHVREAHSARNNVVEHDVVPLKQLKKLRDSSNHFNSCISSSNTVVSAAAKDDSVPGILTAGAEESSLRQVDPAVSYPALATDISSSCRPQCQSNLDSFLCSESDCNKIFHRLKDLKRHKVRFHNSFTAAEEMEYKYSCDRFDCRRRFRTLAGLRQHSASHGDGLLITCDSCKRTFKNRANFAVHLRKYHLMSVRDVNYSPLFVSVSTVNNNSVVTGAA